MFKIKNSSFSICKTDADEGGHNCCTPQPKGKKICPKCGQSAKGVLAKTLMYLLTNKAKEKISDFEGFSYCKSAECKVIYFRGEEILTQDDLSVTVGLKNGAKPANLCYCFGWTKEKIMDEFRKNGKSSAVEDIKEKMNTIGCSCEIKNPSGSCCLADVTKAVKEIEKEAGE